MTENISGPFFNLTKAAKYCGYAPETFRKYLKVYKLPRHGPKRTRFAKSTLDEFMQEPGNFMGAKRRRKGAPKAPPIIDKIPV